MARSFEAEMVVSIADAISVDAAIAEAARSSGGRVVVFAGELAMIGRRGSIGLWSRRSKGGEAPRSRARRFEAAHAVAPLLAMAPGVEFKSEDAAKEFLSANASTLREGLGRIGDCEQHHVTIELPYRTAITYLRDRAAPLGAYSVRDEAKRSTQNGRLSAEAAALGHELGQSALRRLAAAALDFERLPAPSSADGGAIALNVVLMTRRGGAERIDHALDEIEDEWGEGLEIRVKGPEPASAFGSIVVETADLEEAAARLGVAATASRGEIDAAYRKIMRKLHPDRAGERATARAAAISEATRLMRRAADARLAMAEAGFRRNDIVLNLARLYREGERLTAQ